MIPYFSIESFSIGSLEVFTWGFFVALGFLAGLIFGIFQAKKINIKAQKIVNLAIFVYIGAMVGARLFYILQWPGYFFENPADFFKITQGGLMLWGGIFGGLLAGWLYIRKWKNRWKFVDLLTPVIPLCIAIGRIGCFLINDHQGAQTNLPWAIRWPDGTLRHPVALYLILFDLALAGFLWWREGKKAPKCHPELVSGSRASVNIQKDEILNQVQNDTIGKTFLLFLVLYSAGRFFLDFTRDPSADPHLLWFSIVQWISLVLLTIVFVRVIIAHNKSQ